MSFRGSPQARARKPRDAPSRGFRAPLRGPGMTRGHDVMPLLDIQNLSVEFPTSSGVLRAVDGVSLRLDEGEILGVVGESGSGKSVTMLALMGLVAYPGRVKADRLAFTDRDLLDISDSERRQLTGKDVAMIFQEPTTSLNPCFTIEFQLTETLRLHEGMD